MTTVLDPRPLVRTFLAIPSRTLAGAAGFSRSVAQAAAVAGSSKNVDRQVWTAGGYAMLEVRGLDREDVDRRVLAAAVEQAVAGRAGISWTRVDPVTSRIAVRFQTHLLTVADLAQAVAAAEERALAGTGAPEGERPTGPAHPDTSGDAPAPQGRRARGEPAVDDRWSATRDTVTVAADLVALLAAAGGRMGGLPRFPPSLAAVVALAEHQPWLRHRLETVLGRERTDQALGLANAVVHGLTRNAPALLLDGAARGLSLQADRARRLAAAERSRDLRGLHRPPPERPEDTGARPVPLPPGPVERLAGRMARAALLGSGGLLLGMGNPDLAGRAVLVGVPRAAHAARDGFVDALGIGLARRGVVVDDPGALRRLDRVTTVVVQSAVLHEDRRIVVHARADADGWSDARVWRAAQRILTAQRGGAVSAPSSWMLVRAPATESGDLLAGPGATRMLLTDDGRRVGEVLVGRELDQFTDAVLSAVRSAGLRLVLTEDVTATDLAGRADEVLRDGHGDPAWLSREVRRLQAAQEVVAVIGRDPSALDAADVGIGVAAPAGPVPWAADIVCGPGLLEVPRLVGAVPAARAASERGVRVALGASFLGGLLLAVGRPGSGGRAQLPVTVAAGGALLSGVRAARRVVRSPDPAPVQHTPWHALDPGEVLSRLPDPGPVRERVDGNEEGRRSSPTARTVGLLRALASNVRAELDDPLTPVLATGAAASAVIGSPTDALLVGGVLAGSAVISGAQRMRADNALRELLQGQRLPARLVECDGDERAAGGTGSPRRIPASLLRPGHLIDLQAGDVVPADARLLLTQELEVDEATLTGESTPVGKDTAATPGAELPDRTGMVYEGTTVVAGSGRALAVATGDATEAGRALALAGRAAAPAGIQARLEELTSRGLPITLLGGAAVAALALLRGSSLRSAIAGGVSVAVAAVPEGLPLMATVAQLGAARRLSRRGVLVRASRTVEALGRVDTLCFDKTGTLTEGRLRLVRAAGLDQHWSPDAPEARRLLREAAHAGPSPSGRGPLPHATDQAVLDAARTVLGDELEHAWEELLEIPFHSDRGFSAALGRTPSNVRLVVKGAPEVLLPRCSYYRDDVGKRVLDRDGHDRAVAAVHSLAAQGLRVLAVARRNLADLVGEVPGGLPDADDVAEVGDLTLLGFIGLADTARPQAAETVAALHTSGISTVMITGDHPVTAAAIARGLGIPADEIVTGPDLAALEEPARVALVAGASVFARVSPEQKLHIIGALQRNGRVVAMAGDGANDAAAIRLADVGIGMAAKGSTSARSAADLVLTEPDLGLILDSLVEGRAMWRRVRDAVAVLVGGNVGEVGFTLVGTALAGHAPISTRQFLVVNMFTDLLPSMALALAPTPAGPSERAALLAAGPPSMGSALMRDIGVRGAVTSLGALLAWQLGRVGGTRRRAGTIALATLVGAELGQTLLVGGRDPLVLATGIGSAAVLAVIIQTPVVSQLFGCIPLDPLAWGVVLGCSAVATLASAAVPRLLPAQRHPARGLAVPTARAGG